MAEEIIITQASSYKLNGATLKNLYNADTKDSSKIGFIGGRKLHI